MIFHTIGYGGRTPSELVLLLRESGVQTVADIRLRPQRASMGYYVLVKSPDKGIQGLLGRAGIGYRWIEELGNPFLGDDKWQEMYRKLIHSEGETRCKELFELEEPVCLLCAEKRVAECHRLQVAEFLIARGHTLAGHL
ncbi:MAG: DUF488 domain-containing protein [Planctomycetes bacterium]|nr:DUF488 domain-containing protein [Planctomycetota bacterium]